jgi:ribosome-associated protein
MIVASGNTVRQVTAMANNLIKKYKEVGIRTPSPEGMSNGDWVLIDANDILIHIFRPEVRDFYSLEKMWEKSLEEITPDVIKS